MNARTSDHAVLHLVIPDLFTNQAMNALTVRLEAFERLLSRAYVEPWTSTGWTASILQLFDLPAKTEPPLAALTRLFDVGDCAQDYWLRVDPVYFKADQDRVLLFDAASVFALSQAEADGFIQALNQHFAEDGLQFSAPTPNRWYVRLSQHADLHTVPVSEMLGRDVFRHMPTGDDALTWKKYLNEIQMLLHQNPINEAREARGELPVNSVWPWGLGQLPTAPIPRWAGVWSDDPLVQGLAKLTQAPAQTQPANAQEWLNQINTAGDYLLTLQAPLDALQDCSAWLQQVNEQWCLPLLSALSQRQLETLVLYPCDQRMFCLTRSRARHWWRRRVPWQQFLPTAE